MHKTALRFLLAGAGSSLAALQVDFESTSSVKAAAKDVAFVLMSSYKGNQSGGIPGLLMDPGEGRYDWWTNALVWSAMIDYWHYTGDDSYNNVTALWGTAAMQAAEVGFPSPPEGEPSWIELAKAVFDNQAARLSAEEACGGGLRMALSPTSALYDSKDTAATAAFLNLGARLYRFTNNETYAEWAERSWNWLTGVGLVDDEFNVWDVAHDGAEWNCSHITKLRWSNPATVLLQATAYMTSQIPNTTTAHQTWQNRLTSLTTQTLPYFFPNNGPLIEPTCETADSCSSATERIFFKNIAMRALAGAAAVVPALREREPEHAVARALRASAEGAARACDAGEDSDSRGCRLSWTDETPGGWYGLLSVPAQLNALAAVMAPLVGEAAELRRAEGGEDGESGDGESGGDGNGGGGGGGHGGGEGVESGNGNGDGAEGGGGNGENVGASTRAAMGLVLAGLVAALLW
ncbi:glycosyl hydrolase family 76-domain-containing protein [Chaetomium sp. MPI-CAGE-AT-0009]|nr:glycosyl hydrolase family 76-domain-containing protein [Chaetomium sp. MPI-CAGE-AT-0009]